MSIGPSIFVLSIIAIPFVFVFGIIWLSMRPQNSRYGQEETELIQELNAGLTRMAGRVEALETLLMDKQERKIAGAIPPPLRVYNDHK